MNFDDKFFKQQFEKFYHGFLSDSELGSVLDGKDLYFDARAIEKRVKKQEQIRRKEERESYFF